MILLVDIEAFFAPHILLSLDKIVASMIGPQIITTGQTYFVIVRDPFRIVFNKKSIATFEDRAPKANQGSSERVKRLPGNNAAGASTHKTYQC